MFLEVRPKLSVTSKFHDDENWRIRADAQKFYNVLMLKLLHNICNQNTINQSDRRRQKTHNPTGFLQELFRHDVILFHLASLDGNGVGRVRARLPESSFINLAELPVADNLFKINVGPVNLIVLVGVGVVGGVSVLALNDLGVVLSKDVRDAVVRSPASMIWRLRVRDNLGKSWSESV